MFTHIKTPVTYSHYGICSSFITDLFGNSYLTYISSTFTFDGIFIHLEELPLLTRKMVMRMVMMTFWSTDVMHNAQRSSCLCSSFLPMRYFYSAPTFVCNRIVDSIDNKIVCT